MRLPSKIGIAAAACVMSVAGTAACGSSGTSPSSSAKDVLTIALGTPPVSLDPSRGGNGPTAMYQAPAYQSLLHLEGDGGTESPSLAESFKWVDARNTELQVVLRPGLKFSDGTALDAAAVKASTAHFATNGSAFAYVGQRVASVDTPDARTVVFKLKEPDPTFPNQLAETSGLGMIINPKAIADKANLGTSTAGAGPYALSTEQTVVGTTYTYLPNPHYYDKSAVKYQKIVIKVIADPNTALAALQSGQVQVAYATPAGFAQAKAAGLNTAAFPGATNGLFFQDHGKLVPALGDIDVRRAINYAIDRKSAAEAVTLGTGKPTVQLPVAGSLGHDPALEDVYPHDLAKAKELMAKAGYADGFTLPTLVPAFVPTSSNLAQTLADQLAKIGITLKLESVTTIGAYAAAQGTAKFGATVFAVGFPLGVPSAASVLFGPTAQGNPRREEFPTVMPAIKAASALSGDAAATAWQRINKTIVDEALEAPIMTEVYGYFFSKDVQGVDESIAVNPVYMAPTP
ncbi:ABC transporter substrate-binding protein [Actinocorallia sp. A-T 12471]|uniref:ABC transporter substrate-binding protein n=1 Tax=Actinocorallia sp. A-T 12471 TaxID=3089813 RepID=UPI0029CF27B1|nr:ABC transporter substrate-binding protein [Actinocorallia sp. A-T 12471]MDX6740216.1 ABC transporter substrate-binding protein [Actinocorallia sp. A-T 12471]